jgi:hypothetical protein
MIQKYGSDEPVSTAATAGDPPQAAPIAPTTDAIAALARVSRFAYAEALMALRMGRPRAA